MRLLILLLPLSLMACAQIEHRTDQDVPPSPVQEAPAQLTDCAGLNYYHALPGLSVEQQQQALIALRQKITSTGDPCKNLYLALLLSQGDRVIRDEAEAEDVLQSLFASPVSNQDQALARLLLEVIELRRQVKDDLIKISSYRSRLKKARKGSAEYQRQLIELKSQLQQLQSLEQVIDQQEQAINPPQTDNDGN